MEKVDLYIEDCNGLILFYIVFCYGMVLIIIFFVKSGGDINRRSYNGLIFFYSVVVCFVISVFWFLLDFGSDFFVKDYKVLMVLYYVVKDIEVVGIEYFGDLYVRKLKDWIEVGLKDEELWERGKY